MYSSLSGRAKIGIFHRLRGVKTALYCKHFKPIAQELYKMAKLSKFTPKFNSTNMVHPTMVKKLLAAIAEGIAAGCNGDCITVLNRHKKVVAMVQVFPGTVQISEYAGDGYTLWNADNFTKYLNSK